MSSKANVIKSLGSIFPNTHPREEGTAIKLNTYVFNRESARQLEAELPADYNYIVRRSGDRLAIIIEPGN